MFTPKRPDPPHVTRSKKAPEGVPVQRIGFRARRSEVEIERVGEADVPAGAPVVDAEIVPDQK